MKRQIFTLVLAALSFFAAGQSDSNHQLHTLTKLNLELQGFGFQLNQSLVNFQLLIFLRASEQVVMIFGKAILLIWQIL
jgi:hypothetical protein